MQSGGSVIPARVDPRMGQPAGPIQDDTPHASIASTQAQPAAEETPASAVTRLEARVAELQEQLAGDLSCERVKGLLSVALVDLGTNLKFVGRIGEGVGKYVESLSHNPNYCAAHYNLGVHASETGKTQEALAHYDSALRCNPLCVEALCNIGVLKRQTGDIAEACTYFERTLRVRPNLEVCTTNYSAALSDLGTQLQNQGKPAEAYSYYKRAMLMQPYYVDVYYNLGVAASCLKGIKKNYLEKSIYYYTMAVHFKPDYAEAWNNLGVVYKTKGAIDKAVECYEKALLLNPTLVQTMNNLAVLVAVGGQMDRAQSLLRSALLLAPTYAEAHNNLGVVLRDEGVMEESLQCYQRCLQLCPEAENAAQNRLLALNFSTEIPTSEVQSAHLEWGHRISAQHNPEGIQEYLTPLFDRLHKEYPLQDSAHLAMINAKKLPSPWGNHLSVQRKIRVGYVSPDFCLHSVSYFVHNLLKFHNRDAIEVFCFSNTLRHDAKTYLFKTLVGEDNWIDIVGKDMTECCRLITEQRIDILVDLTGHTSTNRLDIFLRRPAPIQVTWIGYPNSTGLKEIDYRITDAQADPWSTPGIEGHYAETLYRMPQTFLCYCPDTVSNDEKREEEKLDPIDGFMMMHKGDMKPIIPQRSAFEQNGYMTFGTFNNMAKINDEVVEVWAEILRKLPNSRLFLKSKPFAEARVSEAMAARFVAKGVERSRIELVGIIAQHYNHLQAYEKIDVALDCWPYAGTTTTCEALWMGKPVVTLTGTRHAANVGASLLTSVGCPELIASTKEKYVEIALSLAESSRLQKYQQNLQKMMANSVLCDGKKFAGEAETAFKNMWHAFCENKKVCQRGNI